MSIKYANLNTKSHSSCGLGIGTAEEIIKTAKEKGLESIALTDVCTASGLLSFYNKGKDLNFPVILGVELFFHYNTELFRFILLAKNQTGYNNICKLVTASSENKDSYPKPCVSLYDISDFKEGLYCISSEVKMAHHLESIFKNDFFYELILSEDNIIQNKEIIKKENIVITSDAYLPDNTYKILQDIMITNTAFGYSKEIFKESKPILSLMDMMKKVAHQHNYIDIPSIKKAIANTLKISEVCSKIELKFKDQVVNYPHLLHPLNQDSSPKDVLIRKIIDHYGRLPDDPVYKERLEYELDAIRNNGRVDLTDYFLVVEDICRWCRDNGIPVGPGRGSGAGSLVNYCLKITHLDPIKYGLLFERFISKGRIQKGNLPDIDIDFAEQEPVRNYIIETYGENRVIPIGTMQTLKARGAIKDVFRALYPDLDFQYVQNICNALGDKDQEESELEFFERGIEESEVLRTVFEKYPTVQENVIRLLGYNRQPGVHPCGVAISQDPLDQILSLRKTKDGTWAIEYSADDCEKSGIIKYDILGLTTLKFIQMCLNLTGIEDLYSIPLEDEKTFKAFKDGDTESVFQFNSDVSINILKQIPLEKFTLDTLCMVTAVGRPGPMKNNQHNEFIKRINGIHESIAPHPALSEVVDPTYGIMIYQESVMKAAQILGGFSLAEADDIRKAMGKKKASLLVPYKSRFIEYCTANFPDTKEPYKDGEKTYSTKAEYIFELMATFSGYGFNKSHSMAYALIGYYCQYLKVHYPIQWWTACMTYAGKDHLKGYYNECQNHTINPDINNSESQYTITQDNKIQMPFTSIKGLGPKASEEILKNRPYTSFKNFFEKVSKSKVNKKVVEKLIFCGCFDSFGKTVQELIDEYYLYRGDKKPEQYASISQSLIMEERAKSLSFLSSDYYVIYDDFFPSNEVVYFKDLIVKSKGVTIGGIIKEIKKRKTKQNKEYADVIIENDGEEIAVKLWPEDYELYKSNLEEKKVVKFIGYVSEYNSKKQFTATNMYNLIKE